MPASLIHPCFSRVGVYAIERFVLVERVASRLAAVVMNCRFPVYQDMLLGLPSKPSRNESKCCHRWTHDFARVELVTADDLEAYYRCPEIRFLIVGIGLASFTEELTTSLLSQLDRNADGHVSEVEFVGSIEAFQSLDLNDNGLMTVDEVREALEK